MIDCSRTKNYLTEWRRMTKQQKNEICKLNCVDCPLNIENNSTGLSCPYFEMRYPKKAITLVQKWSNEHPQKTYLSEFLKNYPNAPLVHDGTPEICLRKLGLTDIKTCRVGGCVECWNQPIEESESK
nr:MAG TPA: Protein of unknown function (DUF1289) [Caudoviricetes sp.]